MFTSSPLPSDRYVLDVVASTSSCLAKGIVSTVATVPTSWVVTRSLSMASVDLVRRGSYVQLSLGERVDRSNPHGFSRREAQSRSAAAKGTLPMVRDPRHLPEHVEDEAFPPTPTRHVGAGDDEGFGAYVGEGRLAQAMACPPARQAGS